MKDEVNEIILNSLKPHFKAYIKACDLSKIEQIIFYKKYFKKEQNWKIAQEVNYSEKQVQRIYNRVKEKIKKLQKDIDCP